MKTKIKFKGCKDLDFSDNYRPACKRQLIKLGTDSKLFWMRPDYGENNPLMVQFCKKRGRLNNPELCLSESHSMCSDYEEIEHIVSVDKEELES